MVDKQVVSVTPLTARRSFTEQFKHKLVQQAMLPDVSLAALAKANDINPNQLARWCGEHHRADNATEMATLAPVDIAPTVAVLNPASSPTICVGEMEWHHAMSSGVVRGSAVRRDPPPSRMLGARTTQVQRADEVQSATGRLRSSASDRSALCDRSADQRRGAGQTAEGKA